MSNYITEKDKISLLKGLPILLSRAVLVVSLSAFGGGTIIAGGVISVIIISDNMWHTVRVRILKIDEETDIVTICSVEIV